MVREEAFAWSRNNAGRRVKVSNRAVQLLVRNLRGLTLRDARQLARNVIYNDGAISESDIAMVMQEKFKLLNRDGVLQVLVGAAERLPSSAHNIFVPSRRFQEFQR